MISSKKQLKEVLKEEKELYLPLKDAFKSIITSDNKYQVFRYIRLLRKTEYYYNNRSSFFKKLSYVCARRRKNILGRKLGIEMCENTFDKGLLIYHPGNIVINKYSKIGRNCKLHGCNCIGNNGKSTAAPILGDNVRLGVGSCIIGNVTIADNVTVAAGAVVVKSCEVEGAVLAGVPAKIVKIDKEFL